MHNPRFEISVPKKRFSKVQNCLLKYGKCSKNFEHQMSAQKAQTNIADPDQTASSEAV